MGLPSLASKEIPSIGASELSGDSIRLLTLLSGIGKEDIQCFSEIVRLQDKPLFMAVSYTWGSSKFHMSFALMATVSQSGTIYIPYCGIYHSLTTLERSELTPYVLSSRVPPSAITR